MGAGGKRRDVRLSALALVVLGIAIIGTLLRWQPFDGADGILVEAGTAAPERVHQAPDVAAVAHPETMVVRHVEAEEAEESVWEAMEPWIDPTEDALGHMAQARREEVRDRFDQAVAMLHAKRFDEALTALDRTLLLAPDLPEAHVNRGYAWIGKGAYDEALAAFQQAMALNPAQANAYYGAAIAYEGLADLESALGGMRSFLHLNPNKSARQIHNARARSAIWEWEAQLGRGPWGPTRGIPPGFSEEELKRDGRGVAIKLPLPGTADEDGNMKYEIKHQDKFQMFDP